MTSIINSSAWSIALPVGIGLSCGIANFLYGTITQKVCMIAGMKFEEMTDPDDVEIPSSQRLDKEFTSIVITYPIAEELIFRGLLQTYLAKGIALYLPRFAAPVVLGISSAALISSAIIGMSFGVLHYFNYEKGGAAVATIGLGTGLFLGIIKEKIGLLASISAHMTSNLCVGLLDKYYPEFLESDREKELRLLTSPVKQD